MPERSTRRSARIARGRREQFARLFGERDASTAPATATPTGPTRRDADARSACRASGAATSRPTPRCATLDAAGFADPAGLLAHLDRVRAGARYVQLPAMSRQRVDALVPQLLAVASTRGRRRRRADRVRAPVRAARGGEPAQRLPRAPHRAPADAAAARAADGRIAVGRGLPDAPPDPARRAARRARAPRRARLGAWRAELARLLAGHAGDAERQMDALRHFQHAQTFRLLAQDLAGTLTVERLADHLSALADIILAATLAEVLGATWKAATPAPPRFAIIGYGKLGGKELGYASDLDLVFLYDDDGRRAAQERYARLAQRLITWLTSDDRRRRALRHRPAAAPRRRVGPASSSSLAGFRRYEREQAWTWEHQALTRARFVAGDAAIGAAFEARARGDPVPAARSRGARGRRDRHAAPDAGGPPEPDGAVRPQARPGRHGRRRVRRPVPRARARARPRGADEEPGQHRAARHRRRPRARSGAGRRRRGGRLSRLSPPAAPDPADRRPARARRRRGAGRAPRRRRRAVDPRFRRARWR